MPRSDAAIYEQGHPTSALTVVDGFVKISHSQFGRALGTSKMVLTTCYSRNSHSSNAQAVGGVSASRKSFIRA